MAEDDGSVGERVGGKPVDQLQQDSIVQALEPKLHNIGAASKLAQGELQAPLIGDLSHIVRSVQEDMKDG